MDQLIKNHFWVFNLVVIVVAAWLTSSLVADVAFYKLFPYPRVQLPESKKKTKKPLLDESIDYANNLSAWSIFSKKDQDETPQDDGKKKPKVGDVTLSKIAVQLIGTVVVETDPRLSHAIVVVDNEWGSVFVGSLLGDTNIKVELISHKFIQVNDGEHEPKMISLSDGSGSKYLYWKDRLFSAVKPSKISKPGAIRTTFYNDRYFGSKVFIKYTGLHVAAARAPRSGIHADNFSIRFEGYLLFKETGHTTLCVENDDGARLFLHGKKIIDDWVHSSRKKKCRQINVQKGWHPLRVDFFDNSGPAWLRVTSGPDIKQQSMLSRSRLCCDEPDPDQPKK